MSVVLLLLLLAIWAPYASSVSKNRLNDALYSILGHLRPTGADMEQGPLRKRCSGRVACENPTVAVEAERIVFADGVLYVRESSPQVEELLRQLGRLPGARPNHLPSVQVQMGSQLAWKAGPEVKVSPTYHRQCDWSSTPNTHAVFHIPWETNNAFHTLNDNILSVLANIIVQYITSPAASPQDMATYVLYQLNPVGRAKAGAPSLLLNLFPIIFGADNVKPAKALFTGGPHCVRKLSWAAAQKPFYKDTLLDLRQASYEVLHHIVHAYMRDSASAAVQKGPIFRPLVEAHQASLAAKRVVIVTRNNTHSDPLRRLHPVSELQLQRSLEALGYSVEVCCDFKVVNTMPLVLEHFLDVDVCIGIHGAGMTNCIFGKPGMIVLELQTFHGYGVLSFPKLAHMAGGDYIAHDMRGMRKIPGKSHAGIVLPDALLDKIVESLRQLDSVRRRYPADNGMLTTVQTPAVRQAPGSEQQSDALRGIHVLAIDAKRRNAFLLPARNSTQVTTTLRGYEGYAVKPLQAHLDSAEYTLDRTEHLAKFLKTFERLAVARNNGTYWVAPYPTRTTPAYTRESILGPETSKALGVCMNTVYYELRKLCFPPQNRETQVCDPPPPIKKRIGMVDSVLDRDFYK